MIFSMNIIHENKITIIAQILLPFLVHVGAVKATWAKIDARWHKSNPIPYKSTKKTVLSPTPKSNLQLFKVLDNAYS